MFSNRARKVDISGIRRVFDLAATLKDPINLSIGQPDFPVSKRLMDSACQAIASGKNGYSQTQGIGPLREQIRAKYRLSADDSRDVFVTSGVSGGLFLTYLALLNPGDEILIPDPFFCAYRDVAYLVEGVPIYYDCYDDSSVKVESWECLITPRTKAILVNSPSNPTGGVLSEKEMTEIVEFAKLHDLWLISDEIYESFTYDSEPRSFEGRYEKLIVLNGYSKSVAVTGWRLGFAIAPRLFIEEIQKLQQYTFVCAPTPLQWALTAVDDSEMQVHLAEYRAKRDLICDLLEGTLQFSRPGGAFYLFAEAPGGSGEEFVRRCIAERLLIVPGSAFSRRDTHFRVSFAASESQLRLGAEVIKRVSADCR